MVARAALVAGAVSGAPSTLHAVVTGTPALGATRAAGTLVGRPTVPAGILAHTAVTAWWTTVLAAVLPRRRPVLWGAAAGLGIGVLDLGVLARPFPAIRALPRGAQLADHVAFGAVVGLVLARGRWRGGSGPPTT